MLVPKEKESEFDCNQSALTTGLRLAHGRRDRTRPHGEKIGGRARSGVAALRRHEDAPSKYAPRFGTRLQGKRASNQ